MAYSLSNDSKLEQIRKWCFDDIQRWQGRNERFQRDQELFQLAKPMEVTAKNAADIIILNDPRVLVKKVSRLIARHPNIIEVPSAPGLDPVVGQKVENFLYAWDRANNQRWMMGLHNPYRFDQAFYLVLRGWSVERTLLNPDGVQDISGDPSALWDHQVFDPANIYPFSSGNQVQRICHAYNTTIGELKGDPLYAKEMEKTEWKESEDTATVHLRACYYMADGSWWHCVTVNLGSPGTDNRSSGDGEFLKKPMELGYNPWTIVLANGASYGDTPWGGDYQKEIGTGLLDDMADNQKYMNRMITRLSELLSLESNPPVSYFGAQGTIKKINFGPGERNFLAQKDRVEAHRIGPSLNDYQLMWDILQKRADRATLPGQFFAEYNGESGFSATTILAAGKDILYPFTEAVNQADALKYRKVLELYRDFGPAQSLPVRMPADGMGRVASEEITPQEVYMQGTYVEITREDMTPQEYIQRINAGLAMLKDHAISLETFRKEFAKLKNPSKENLQVLAEMVYMNEGVIQTLIPEALSGSGQENLRHIWEMLQNPMPPQGPQPQGPPAGPPGQPPQMQQPASQPGLPAQVLPPVMQTGNPMTNTQVAQGSPEDAMMNQLLAMMSGGAQGGGGMGGTPPPGGGGSPIPLMRPPGMM